MIVNSSQAAVALVQALNDIKPLATAWRAVHIHVPTETEEWDMVAQQDPIHQVRDHLTVAMQAQGFFCNHGHLVILVRGARLEDLEKIERVAKKAFGIEETDQGTSEIYDLSVKWNELKEKALEYARQDSEQVHKKQEVVEDYVSKILNRIDMDYAKGLLQKRAHRKGIHILVAEDDEFTQRIVSSVLSDFSLIKASRGSDVLSSYLLNAPDMVFLDINLPEIDGHKLLDEILLFDPDAFVVMLSGNAQIKNVMRSMDAGARGFVAKPFPKEKLQNYARMCADLKETRFQAEGF